MRIRLAAVFLVVAAGTAGAQSSSDQVAAGDKEYAALNAPSALAHYQKAFAADPRNFEALWKASRSAVDIGSYAADESRQTSLFSLAEQFARRALALNPESPEGHFALARALGKTALAQSPRGRVKYATEIRSQALECLKLDPRHAGCLHVMGMWNAEVMRLNGFLRMVAKNFLGGKVFASASWSGAVSYMQRSVANEPNRIIHHLDLAGIYRDTGDKAHERLELEAALRLPETDFNDAHYKGEAKAELAAIR
ncbi:MAG TPA: hypothetical protein VM053_07275 [Gemmatimonadaceae bacterium]|nr:hypothetical protein [Gemmatimonadaceae bacterium]